MVLQRLKEVAENLTKHLADSLRNKMHKEFVDCKIKSALKFVSLLTRMIAVIQTKDIASRYLKNQEARSAMLESWLNVSILIWLSILFPARIERISYLMFWLMKCSIFYLYLRTLLVTVQSSSLNPPSRFLAPTQDSPVTAGSLLTACLIEIGLYGRL